MLTLVLTLRLAWLGEGRPRINVAQFEKSNSLFSDCNNWPSVCPGTLPTKMKQTWEMNMSTIIMPCNNTGFTDPATTRGWGIVDFDWSNSKGTGAAQGWAKHQPMDDEEMLFQQVKMTTSATKGTTVWVYRCSVYGYPWYTTVRKLLEDPKYHPWFMSFKNEGPWFSKKCDSYKTDVCSNLYHSQEQSPGYPHGDGDCALPGCDCGKGVPCGFYVFNHSSTVEVNGQTFQDWFVHDYMLNYMKDPTLKDLISGMFWDDVWNPECDIHDQVPKTCEDMGLVNNSPEMVKLTRDYQSNMAALRDATLNYGKFSWQMLWTGEGPTDIGNTCPHPIVSKDNCIVRLRDLCRSDSPAQTRAMMYQITIGGSVRNFTNLRNDIANFLLIRGPYAWLGHGWKGCSQDYLFPEEFDVDYGEPVLESGSNKHSICKETSSNSGIFVREYSRSIVKMDCNNWQGSITMKTAEKQTALTI
eukprot:TRINITY_DN57545_c0_g1_i1.p1 TRINITY_DN57545_c0_g1~~TRINITY_DN57545_c0_g1_i1.p1  ORF type:complete len:469 (+),score=24.52 TRINITY_DN57545_c0_g1_i1:64-1470(+)